MHKESSTSEQYFTRTGKYSDRISRRGYLPESSLPERCPTCDRKFYEDDRLETLDTLLAKVKEDEQRKAVQTLIAKVRTQDVNDAELLAYWLHRGQHFEEEYKRERKKRQSLQNERRHR